jgi:hypothetical protein
VHNRFCETVSDVKKSAPKLKTWVDFMFGFKNISIYDKKFSAIFFQILAKNLAFFSKTNFMIKFLQTYQ